MRITVRLFASYREAAGANELTLDTPEGTTVDGALSELVARFPRLATYRQGLVVAVNAEYAERAQCLHDGDELALIPPVSGG